MTLTKHNEMKIAAAIMAVCGCCAGCASGSDMGKDILRFSVAPASPGKQLVRLSLPFARGALDQGQCLMVSDGGQSRPVVIRVLTTYPGNPEAAKSVRRAIVTFPYDFASTEPKQFSLHAANSSPEARHTGGISAEVAGNMVTIRRGTEVIVVARLLAPERVSAEPAQKTEIEKNAFFSWVKTMLPDNFWPRAIEVRCDALGTVTVVAHLQRDVAGDGYAPEFGWDIELHGKDEAVLDKAGEKTPATGEWKEVGVSDGKSWSISFGDGLKLYHPAAQLKRCGKARIQTGGDGTTHYQYIRCVPDDRIPMQRASWRRVEFVIAPENLAELRPTLEYPHRMIISDAPWHDLYEVAAPSDFSAAPELVELIACHHDAIVASMSVGKDWGNVTGFNNGSPNGSVFGMNRLNHCPAIFFEGWRTGDRRLVETAVLWCDNFYDQTIWWGPVKTGGTRYNNQRAMGLKPPDDDNSYMWRSNSAVHFCTKGYDSFFLAYEQTGDPRMMDALDAQLRYAATEVHTDQGECRNIGDVLDFVRVHRYTGDEKHLDNGLRLFRELTSKLMPNGLFSQGGHPIMDNPPYIEDDAFGYKNPFAKPYIIGYALSGLPELARHAPDEPRLRQVIQAVADFLSESQDPLGGWRYPHPRSSYMICCQAMEHAWQITQADKLLGPQERHLDAIERVLRQRLHGWKAKGTIFSGLSGWETATGKVKSGQELYALYKKPEDRDFQRDYDEGSPGFGSSSPEGLVYFPEVLDFYLRHRPASRLLDPPEPGSPLDRVLKRAKGGDK